MSRNFASGDKITASSTFGPTAFPISVALWMKYPPNSNNCVALVTGPTNGFTFEFSSFGTTIDWAITGAGGGNHSGRNVIQLSEPEIVSRIERRPAVQ